jgi:CubicO group peptidase (beta-lactamase class C family)
MNTFRKIQLVCFSACLLGFVFQPVRTSMKAPSDAVDAYMQAQLEEWHIPGAALIIVQDGQVTHLRTFGQARAGIPITPQTPFEIGSCSKSLTALAVMQLSEAGQIDLNAPIQRYLSWFHVADENASGRITIRHLLAHTSGLPTIATNSLTMVNLDGKTLEQQVRSMSDLSITAAPGTLYQYSNFNYMTLALIIETVSGQSYGDYLQKNVFSPLDMQNSFTDPAIARQHGLSDGHTWWFEVPFRSLESPRLDMLGAGYIMVSPEDMSHYLIVQLNGGIYGNTRVLSENGVTIMHTPAQLPEGQPYYGMGWASSEYAGQTVVNHDGKSASFTCSMILLPDRRTGIAVMANVSSLLGPHAASSLAFHIKDMLVTGQTAQVDPLYRQFYLPWDLGFLLATGFLIWSILFDFLHWVRRTQRGQAGWSIILPFIADGLLMLAAMLGLPLSLGWARWLGMFVWQPDAAYWCVVASILLLLKLTLRTILLFRQNRKIHP